MPEDSGKAFNGEERPENISHFAGKMCQTPIVTPYFARNVHA